MDGVIVEYAGMDAGRIAAWLLIATGAGVIARRIVGGGKVLGLWGDAAIGLVGVFLVGTLMRAFHFDLSVFLHELQPAWSFDLAIWVDIIVSGLIGALLIRSIMRPFVRNK
ncbi:MAG: hypothetical protein R3C52_08120 [Hyphomonadaceae bacterium]